MKGMIEELQNHLNSQPNSEKAESFLDAASIRSDDPQERKFEDAEEEEDELIEELRKGVAEEERVIEKE